MTALEEQFWLRQPYAVLFDLLHLHRVKPWDVNLASLLGNLMGEMKTRGFIDFSVSGTALLSSAVLLRMNVMAQLADDTGLTSCQQVLVSFLPDISEVTRRAIEVLGSGFVRTIG